MIDQEALRVESNIGMIMGYLAGHFEGFVLEVNEHPSLNALFILTHHESGDCLTLDVGWSKLSDTRNTAAVIRQKLTEQDLGEHLRRSTGTYFWTMNAPPEGKAASRELLRDTSGLHTRRQGGVPLSGHRPHYGPLRDP